MGIQVDLEALTAAARSFQQVASSVTAMRGGITTATDQAAGAAGDSDVRAGLATFQQGMAAALDALATRTGRYSTKVRGAASGYHGTDLRVANAIGADALPGVEPAPVSS